MQFKILGSNTLKKSPKVSYNELPKDFQIIINITLCRNIKKIWQKWEYQKIQIGVHNGGLWEKDIWNDSTKLKTFVYKMILQKYTSLWIDLIYILIFAVYLEMPEIFTDLPTGSKQIACVFCHFQLFCLLPVGKSVNISAIPRYTVKTKM